MPFVGGIEESADDGAWTGRFGADIGVEEEGKAEVEAVAEERFCCSSCLTGVELIDRCQVLYAAKSIGGWMLYFLFGRKSLACFCIPLSRTCGGLPCVVEAFRLQCQIIVST